MTMQNVLKNLGKIMFQGLVTMLPAVLTLYILYWLVWSAETVLGRVIQFLLPQGWYIPGMGLFTGIFGVLLFGLSLNAFLTRRLIDLGDAALNQIPMVKTLYGSLKDFIGFFAAKKEREFNQVVTVEMETGGMTLRMLGFVTRNDFDDLPKELGGKDDIAVYFPLSYQIGGYTVILPRSAVKPVAMSTNHAMGFIVTGGMFNEKGQHHYSYFADLPQGRKQKAEKHTPSS